MPSGNRHRTEFPVLGLTEDSEEEKEDSDANLVDRYVDSGAVLSPPDSRTVCDGVGEDGMG